MGQHITMVASSYVKNNRGAYMSSLYVFVILRQHTKFTQTPTYMYNPQYDPSSDNNNKNYLPKYMMYIWKMSSNNNK